VSKSGVKRKKGRVSLLSPYTFMNNEKAHKESPQKQKPAPTWSDQGGKGGELARRIFSQATISHADLIGLTGVQWKEGKVPATGKPRKMVCVHGVGGHPPSRENHQ